MATDLDLHPNLIDDVLQLSGERSKAAAVTAALEEYVARRRQLGLRELLGTLDWDDTFDYKAGRSR